MDFNHRKPLGPLEQLWGYTTPYIPKLKLLIFSLDTLKELALLEGLIDQNTAHQSLSLQKEEDDRWPKLLQRMWEKFKGNLSIGPLEIEMRMILIDIDIDIEETQYIYTYV